MKYFDDYTILLIRQCKKDKTSMRSLRRIVGMKCALQLEHVAVSDVVHFLIEIVREYNLVRDWDEFLIVDLNPKKDYWYLPEELRPKEKSYMENLVDVLISKIMMTQVNIFPYFRSPLRFRK
jgi:hypothetical protein